MLSSETLSPRVVVVGNGYGRTHLLVTDARGRTLLDDRIIVVDADDVAIRSGHVRVKAPWGSEVPVQLRIEVTGTVGSGHFVARPRNRNLWQWLTRQPRPYMIAAR